MTWYLVLFVSVIVGTVVVAQRKPTQAPYSRPRHRRTRRALPVIIHYRGRPFKPTTTIHLPISKN